MPLATSQLLETLLGLRLTRLSTLLSARWLSECCLCAWRTRRSLSSQMARTCSTTGEGPQARTQLDLLNSPLFLGFHCFPGWSFLIAASFVAVLICETPYHSPSHTRTQTDRHTHTPFTLIATLVVHLIFQAGTTSGCCGNARPPKGVSCRSRSARDAVCRRRAVPAETVVLRTAVSCVRLRSACHPAPPLRTSLPFLSRTDVSHGQIQWCCMRTSPCITAPTH